MVWRDMNFDSSRAKASDLASTSVVPIAVLLLAILTAVVVTVFGMAQRTNEAADNRNRHIIATALTNEAVEIARSVRVLLESEHAGEANRQLDRPTIERIRQLGEYDALGTVSRGPGSQIVVRELLAAPDTDIALMRQRFELLAGDLLRLSDTPYPEHEMRKDVAARFLADSGGLRIISGLLQPVSQDAMGLVAMRTLTAANVRGLGEKFAISDLAIIFRTGGQLTNELPLVETGPALTPRLVWAAERPGTPVLESLLPIALFGTAAILVFAVLSFIHVRKVTMSMLTSEQRAQHLAGHDTLSGLPNRMRFSERLAATLNRLAPSQGGIAVMFVDLDKFKDVNDTHGHAAGDRLIVLAAERMQSQLRNGDVLARFGGDEFAIIQHGVRSALDAEVLARRIIEAFRGPFDLGSAEVFIGTSIGIALAPDNASEAAELMRLADIAMYRAKNEGRGRACFFEQRMDDVLRMRKAVEDDLRGAIARDELVVHYQPQVSADGSRIAGVEALVRWNHPTHGMIPPDKFIQIAEERGLIIQLGEWVLRRACRDLKSQPELQVSVNVSAIQFRQPDFGDLVARVVAEVDFEPQRLELELTESVVVGDADKAEECIMHLRGKGIRVALDDFGTGYSSLIYLRRFAFDKIKLDKSFLDSLEDTGESAILVHSVVHLGRALGLTVTAEGVETVEQQRFLQAVGCHLLQGYLFSRPVPIDKLLELLAKDRPFAKAA
jgi:diguanylate cyclase (GGDEF)-like protein